MYKALESFVGKVSMVKGEVKEILDKEVANDLLKAGYIEELADNKVKSEEVKVKEEIKKVISKKRR